MSQDSSLSSQPRSPSSTLIEDWQTRWHDIWAILGNKWSFHIIRLLSDGERGFNEMKRELEGITSTMLSRRLKQLESRGIIVREISDSSPPESSYYLTRMGSELSDSLRQMECLDLSTESN